jgi:hypothetical protein
MSTAWINSAGAGIIDANGNLLLCESCPCADCETQCMNAIRERQSAAGHTRWADGVTKTLAEAISETNGLASDHFIQPWSGGSSAPAFWSTSYANGVADWCELRDLVYDLTHTKVTIGSLGTGDCHFETILQKYGQVNGDQSPATLADAVALAISQEADNIYMQNLDGYWRTGKAGHYHASQNHGSCSVHVLNMTTLVSKVIQLYARFTLPPYGTVKTFDSQNIVSETAVVSPGVWYYIDGTAAGFSAEATTNAIGFPDPVPNYDTPTSDGDDYAKGMAGTLQFAIFAWAFEYHDP